MQIKENESLKEHTTFHTGGITKHFYIPESIEELSKLVRELKSRNESYKILGNGSNLLVSDTGVDFSIIQIKSKLQGIEVLSKSQEEVLVKCLAGTMLSKLANFVLHEGLTGMEGLAGIPGTIGGAVLMNAGAYGTEIKDTLKSCELMTADGEVIELPAESLELSYRHSNIEERGYIVLSASFQLKKGNSDEIQARMEQYRTSRIEKQPLNYPSAGSTFKRPEGNFAGKLIEEAGLRGYQVGQAQVSEKHCGFVINRGKASSTEIYQLIKDVIERVSKDSGIRLEPEVKLWGNF